MLQTMMPEENSMVSWNLIAPLDHQLGDVVEVPIGLKRRKSGNGLMALTYFWPVDSFSGFTSLLLKAAKKSSKATPE